MSVGTNENVNVNEKNINTNNKKFVNQEENNSIDMQATQRIVILEGLKMDTENSLKSLFESKQEEVIPQEETLSNPCIDVNVKRNQNKISNIEKNQIETVNILNSSSKSSIEPIAQAENYSAINMSENSVQENPNQQIQQSNTKNTENQNDSKIANVSENSQIRNGEKTQEVSTEENLKNKEKQHAQDKKDYRLEKMLFDRINKMQGKIKESLELIKKFERINAKEENLPNIVTTLHDKLTHEVIKQFRTVGIEFNMKSYLVQAIVSDLLGKFEDGITEFKDCSENLNFVREVQEDFESKVELAPTSKVKNFFARLRGMFKPERKQEKLEQLERERQEKKLEEANIHLIKYKFINSELEKYTIRKNIVNSLNKEILYGQGSGLTLNITQFINDKVKPEMKMLGLDNLIPSLEENLYKEYAEKDPGVTVDEFVKMPIGELRRNMKLQKADIIRTKISEVVANNKDAENDEERMVV